jgi:hypothetical protein
MRREFVVADPVGNSGKAALVGELGEGQASSVINSALSVGFAEKWWREGSIPPVLR